MMYTDLLTIAIERRRIAVAAYNGLHLSHLQVRELPTEEDQAGVSAQRFVSWAITSFTPQRIAIEAVPLNKRAERRLFLHAIVRGTLQNLRRGSIEVDAQELQHSFALPQVDTRKKLLAITGQILPQLARHRHQPIAHLAALIGIHVQMRDFFSDN